VLPAPALELPKGRSTAVLDAEIRELRSEVAELRAVFQTRPLSDEEIANPSTIPADATFDFGDVDIDLEGLTEEELKAWTLNYIDSQAIEPARRSSRAPRGERHERHG
jgi:type IV secretion system protein VirD4